MLTYCTRSDVESVWSPAAVLEAADDDHNGGLSSAEVTLINEAIERGTGQINAVLETRYTLATLAANNWCRDANAVFAAYFLAARKLEALPAGLANLFAWYSNTLADIGRGRAKVPEAAEAQDSRPVVSNFRPT